MLRFVVLLIGLCKLVKPNVDFSNPFHQAVFLQQFGYQTTTAKTPTPINEIPRRLDTGVYEDNNFRMVNPDTIRKLQQFAGVEQTGVFDEATIGMMMTPRCQNPDIMDESSKLTKFFLGKRKKSSRTKRNALTGWSTRWDKTNLTFAFESTTPQNPQSKQIISSAFTAWGECSKLSFEEVELENSPDITVKFASGLHEPPANCQFDGPGGIKAHAFYPPTGIAHFDEDEDWGDDCVLYTVALHEIGHVLGLGHSFFKNSIMFAYFNPEDVKSMCVNGTRALSNTDIKNIRQLYGSESCDIAAEVVTEKPTGPTTSSISTTPPENIVRNSTATFSSSPADPDRTEPTQPTSQTSPTSFPQSDGHTGSKFLTVGTDIPKVLQVICGEIVDNILSSPYYPEVYPNKVNCSWEVAVPPGMIAVNLYFLVFAIEDGGEECVYDYLGVTPKGRDSVRLCGSQILPLRFETSRVALNFVSDALKQEAGFRIFFTFEAEPEKPPCRVVVKDPAGVITQDHPKIDGQEECTYVISLTESEKQILLIIDDIAQHCSKYTLQDSDEDEATNLMSTCTDQETGPRYFLSETGTFVINFNPQEAGNFAIKYYTIFSNSWQRCSSSKSQDYNSEFLESGRWSPKTQVIDGSEKYFINTDCILLIPRDPQGRELTISIDSLDIEYDKYCKYDFVEIYNEEVEGGVQKYCGQQERIEITTLGDTLVYFHSDYSVEGLSFTLEYGLTECVHTLPESRDINQISAVTVQSDCSYSFEQTSKKHFVCTDEFRAGRGCRGAVEVGEDGTRYCREFSTVAEENETVNFSSLGNFNMSYVTIDSSVEECFQTIQLKRTKDHRFHYKPTKDHYKPPKVCALHFVGKPGYQIVLSFTKVTLKGGCRSSSEYIKVFTGNGGCQSENVICKTRKNLKLGSQDAYVLSYLTDRNSNFKVQVRLESEVISSSLCPEQCEDGTVSTVATTIPQTTLPVTSPIRPEIFRLVDREGNSIAGDGRGLVLYQNGTICDDFFSDNAANAICKELGYAESLDWDSDDSFAGLQSSFPINLDDVRCRNSSWSSCSYSSKHNCAHREDVFLTCSGSAPTKIPIFPTEVTTIPPISTPAKIEIFKLVDQEGDSISGDGRGLVLYHGGTVCDDFFSDNSADAICRELGYDESEAWDNFNTFTNLQNSLPISLDNVKCENNTWSSCTYSETHNCGHHEDVYLTCSGSAPTSEVPILPTEGSGEVDIDACFVEGMRTNGEVIREVIYQGRQHCVELCLAHQRCEGIAISPQTWAVPACYIIGAHTTSRDNGWEIANRTCIQGNSVWYTITYSIADLANANTRDNQYITIKGTDGEADEVLCVNNFDVIDQDVECRVEGAVDIGEYECVVLRTGGSDGLDLSQITVEVAGGETHIVVPQDGDSYIGLDNGESRQFCLGDINSCWTSNTGNYSAPYNLGEEQFTDYVTCQAWCDEDPDCVAVVTHSDLCIKLATENITPQQGAHAALKDCWRRKTHTARTTVIRDDSDAVATCEDGYRAVNCYSDNPMSSVLDGIEINQSSCRVSMSYFSRMNVDVTVTCKPNRTCPSNREITKYKYLKHNDWVTGSTTLECESGYKLLGCYITSAWSPRTNFGTFEHGAKTTENTCSFINNIRYKLSAVCQVTPSNWDENSCTISVPGSSLFSLVNRYGTSVRSDEKGLLLYKGGTVCDDNFGTREAEVVCKELGYYHMVRYESGMKFPELQAGLEIKLDDLSCPESEWGSCSYRDGSHNCQHSEDIFLTCTDNEQQAPPFSIVDQKGNPGAEYGLLLYNGGTVCDDLFSDNAAQAICSLVVRGWQPEDGSSWASVNYEWRIQENYDIKLDNVQCREGNWASCTYDETHNCKHSEDVFISCGSLQLLTFQWID